MCLSHNVSLQNKNNPQQNNLLASGWQCLRVWHYKRHWCAGTGLWRSVGCTGRFPSTTPTGPPCMICSRQYDVEQTVIWVRVEVKELGGRGGCHVEMVGTDRSPWARSSLLVLSRSRSSTSRNRKKTSLHSGCVSNNLLPRQQPLVNHQKQGSPALIKHPYISYRLLIYRACFENLSPGVLNYVKRFKALELVLWLDENVK